MELTSNRDRVSVVLPVRNRVQDIHLRLASALATLQQTLIDPMEIVVVDDGSSDGTYQRLQQIQDEQVLVRVIRHDRPRGMEASGQSGLERSRASVVLIVENQLPIRSEDVDALLELLSDESVVLARTESTTSQMSRPLVRRLTSWGPSSRQAVKTMETLESGYSSLQLIRKPHLQTLSASIDESLQLTSHSARKIALAEG